MGGLERLVMRLSILAGSLVLMAMMLQIVVDVFLRSVIGTAFPATPDLVSRYYMVAVSFLPLAMTEISGRHIEATIFTERLRGSVRKAVLGLGVVIGTLVYGFLTYGSGSEAVMQTARRAYVEAGTIHFPTWPSYWILPISTGLMTLVLLAKLVAMLTGRFREHAYDPLDEINTNSGETN